MNEDKFNELFEEAFEKATENMLPTYTTDHRDAWQKVQLRMEKEQRKRAFRSKVKSLGTIAASILRRKHKNS